MSNACFDRDEDVLFLKYERVKVKGTDNIGVYIDHLCGSCRVRYHAKGKYEFRNHPVETLESCDWNPTAERVRWK